LLVFLWKPSPLTNAAVEEPAAGGAAAVCVRSNSKSVHNAAASTHVSAAPKYVVFKPERQLQPRTQVRFT
jgi:hypothetical protein